MLHRSLDETDVEVGICPLASVILFLIPMVSSAQETQSGDPIPSIEESTYIGRNREGNKCDKWDKSNFQGRQGGFGFQGDKPRQGVYDAGDPLYCRFRIKEHKIKKDSIVVASRQNIYIRFPMLELKSERLEEILAFPPKYVIRSQETRENREARFLLHLYKKEKYVTFLKVYKYFTGRYTDSKYGELIDSLATEVYYKIFQRDGHIHDLNKVRFIHTKLEDKYPKSKLRERNDLIWAYTNLKLRKGVEAVQGFIKIFDRHKGDGEYDFTMLPLAEGYLLLNRPMKALSIYKKLKIGKNPNMSIEASYRVGDVHFHMRSLEEAVKSYQLALKKYPRLSTQFPNAHYNMAESLFWLGRYRESLRSYLNFVEIFPSHRHGGYALTRIGELLGILGADKKKVIGAFLESDFRFKGHPGGQVARARVLTGKMRGMKIKELNRSLREMSEIASHSPLPNMSGFVTLMMAEGFHGRGEYDRALDRLTTFFRQNSENLNTGFFKKKIVENISSKIKSLLELGDTYGALKEYEKHSKTWLQHANRLDLEYFLANALERVGVIDEAISRYESVLSKLESVRKKESESNHFLPTRSVVHLRLAATYMQRKEFQKALSLLEKVRGSSLHGDVEKAERWELLATIYEKRGLYRQAKKYLNEIVGKVNAESSASVRVLLSRLQLRTGELKKAKANIVELEKVFKGSLNGSLREESLRIKAELLLRMNEKMAAFDTYMVLLKEFESHKTMNSIRYKAGEILFEKGDLNGAKKIWAKFQGRDSGLYNGLAKDSFKHEQWMRTYKKYIKKIPIVMQ